MFKDEYVSVGHLLLAMVDDKSGAAGRTLNELGLTRDRLMQALKSVRGAQRVASQNPEATYEALERYGRDLTTTGSCMRHKRYVRPCPPRAAWRRSLPGWKYPVCRK